MHLPNKLAALSLAVVDAALAQDDDLTPTAIAALITISNSQPLSIGDIASIVGLTHSATVRLVDRLEGDGLLRRQRRVGREVLVEITPIGRRRAQALQDRRLEATSTFVEVLSDDERRLLEGLVEKMITDCVAKGRDRRRLCRMCARECCDGCFVAAELAAQTTAAN